MKILGRGKKQSRFYRAPQSQPIRTHFPFSIQDFEPITFPWRLGHPAHRCRNRNQATDKTVVTVAAGWDRNSLIWTRERELKLSHMVRTHCQPHTVYEQFDAYCTQKSSDNRVVQCDWLHWFPGVRVHQKQSAPCSRGEDSGSEPALTVTWDCPVEEETQRQRDRKRDSLFGRQRRITPLITLSC